MFKVLGSTFLLIAFGASAALAITWDLQSSDLGDMPVPNGGTQQTVCVVGDVDGDGADDIIVGERTGAPGVVVYFWRPSGWIQETIEASAIDVEVGGVLADLDNDGDLDLILGGDNAINEMWWWENPGLPPYAAPWTRRLVKNTGRAKHHDQTIGDFDNDGIMELVFWNQQDSDRLFISEVPADPKVTEPWSRTAIFDATDRIEGLATGDINQDGVLDIVGGGFWFEHTSGTSFTAHTIEADRQYTRSAVAQLVPGGRPEIVIGPSEESGPLRWYEWVNNVWVATEIDPLVISGHSLSVGDVDNDGDIDIFSAEMHSPGAGDDARSRIFLNQGGGVFVEETILVGVGNHESRFGDFNGDGWLDIASKPFLNDAPALSVWLQVPDLSSVPDAPTDIALTASPNPFNARCVFRISSDQPRAVDLTIHDVLGRRVATMAQHVVVGAQGHSFTWNGTSDAGALAPSGIYFARASSDRWSEVVKVMMVK